MKKIFFSFVSLLLCVLYVSAADYRVETNIPYSKSTDSYAKERCLLDFYYPIDVENYPTVVWFHGGGLSGGNRFIPDQLKEQGMAVIAVNYRLLPQATLSDCIDDAASAVAWAFDNIASYGGDNTKIFVSGHSAGGYLTNMIGLDKRWLAKYNIDSDSIAGLIPFSGHAISHFAYRQAKGMKDTQPSIDEFAPLYYVRPDAPPLIIVSGDREMEMLGRYEENAYFWRMMKVAGHKDTQIYELDGYDHGAMAAPAFHILIDQVRRILREKEHNTVSAFVTTADRSRDFQKFHLQMSNGSADAQTSITLDPTKRFQTMDGFGVAVTGSTCYNLLQMSATDRARFLKETFSDSEGMGFSYIRVSIGCSDFSLSEYTCCDKEGIDNFSLTDEERRYLIPVLKEILAINPSLKILGSPWTCPKWMKVNNLKELRPFDSWTAGQLNPKYYQDYASYFLKWIIAMEAEGIPIEAVTPQNEPLNRGNSASLFMGWDEQAKFVSEALGPKLKDAGLRTKIYAFDHNYNYDNMSDQQGYPSRMFEDAAAGAYLTGAAYHNYGGDKAELKKIKAKHPNRELIFTETSIGTWNDGRNLQRRLMEDMEEVALGTVNNWCRAVIVWNLMLDSERGPNREGGCQTCYGAVDIDRADYRSITRNSHYYIIGHMSSVVKPGATRIGFKESETADGLIYSAFKNLDGTTALVLLNKSDKDRELNVNDGDRHFRYKAPANSVVSFRWR